MKKTSQTTISALKTEVIHDNGRIKIRLTKNSKGQETMQTSGESRNPLDNPLGSKNFLAKVSNQQPAKKIPGITRKMARNDLLKLLKNRTLNRQSVTVLEWLLAECHLAKALKLSPLQVAHLVSETLHTHTPSISNHCARLLSAR